jgi:hypothetical protein
MKIPRRTKNDKQFMIEMDCRNRDNLQSAGYFIMTSGVSLISLLVSTCAVIIAIRGIDLISKWLMFFLALIIIFLSIAVSQKAKKVFSDAKKLNNQAQMILLDLYPEYNKKYR